jgi:hypothetical protein
MTVKAILATTLLLTVATGTAGADQLLWDNYPGGLDALQDVNFNMSSERNTAVYEPTWIVDDVDFAQIEGVDPSLTTLTQLEWVGARQVGYTYSTVDVIVLDGQFNTLCEVFDLPYTFTDHDSVLDPSWQLYQGQVSLAGRAGIPDLDLPEHFYVGIRLVGDGYYQGRNRNVTSSIDQTIRGRTQGHMKAAIFGAPDWTPASEVWYAPPTDHEFEFAFRVYADVVPEPASVVLLLAGSLAVIRRR